MRKTCLLLTAAVAAFSIGAQAYAGEDEAAQSGSLSPEQVRMIQRALNDRGFAVDLTGKYDDQTKIAIQDFQRSRGMEPTGMLSSDTKMALGVEPQQAVPVRGEGAGEATASSEPGPSDPAWTDGIYGVGAGGGE